MCCVSSEQRILVKRSISKSAKISSGVCVAQWVRRDESCARKNGGCFTMTTHLIIMPWTPGSSWSRRTSHYWEKLPFYLTMIRVTFFFSQVVTNETCVEVVDAIKMELRGIKQYIQVWQKTMEKCIRLEEY